MAFIETQFPTDISYGASGGAGFNTDVVEVQSGNEMRNAKWSAARCMYDVSHGLKTQAQLDVLIAFFRVMGGKAHGFRFKDWSDYTATGTQGLFTSIDATHFQMYKRYTTAANNHDRTITKPVNGTIVVSGGVVDSINYATGIVTMSSGTPSGWTGEFDVPCRFDTDQMKVSIEHYGAFTWGSIPVIEIRT